MAYLSKLLPSREGGGDHSLDISNLIAPAVVLGLHLQTRSIRPPCFAWAGATLVGGGGGPAPAFAEPGWVG